MSASAADATTILIVALCAVVFPWLAMRMIVPALKRAPMGHVTNYRGRTVVAGLGLVWVAWTIGMLGAGRIMERFDRSLAVARNVPYSALPAAMPFVLVLGVFALGFADDVFGSSAERGFRGHLGALRQGRLTTGGLKLLGVGLLAAVTVRPTMVSGPRWKVLLEWLVEVLAIALTANLVNLLDLRPGRALKFYGFAATVCAVSFAFWGQWVFSIELACALLGPVIAVWGFDLGERGMLGDAGANAMGALLGWVVAIVLPVRLLALYVVVVLALNLLSERISFSRAIEGNPVLSWIDGIGRLPAGEPAISDRIAPISGESAKTSHHSETNDR